MFKAIDSIENIIWVSNADKYHNYRCPICRQKVIYKEGKLIASHFAHYGARGDAKYSFQPCQDNWHYDMTQWHFDWQCKFPEKCREVIIEKNGKKHIADVLINNIVIEFQHSPITIEEFRNRNDFYKSLGYKVVWVFDVINEVSSHNIKSDYNSNNGYFWYPVPSSFTKMEINQEDAIVYFQICEENDSSEYFQLYRIKKSYSNFKKYFVDLDCCFTVKQFADSIRSDTATSDIFPKQEITHIEGGKRIIDFWKSEYRSIIVTNLVTGQDMLITGHNGSIFFRNRKVITGKYTSKNNDGSFNYSKDYYPIKNAFDSIWSLKHYNLQKKEPVPKSEDEEKNIILVNTEEKQQPRQESIHSNLSFADKQSKIELLNPYDPYQELVNYASNPRQLKEILADLDTRYMIVFNIQNNKHYYLDTEHRKDNSFHAYEWSAEAYDIVQDLGMQHCSDKHTEKVWKLIEKF